MWRVAQQPQKAVDCYRRALACGADGSGVWTNLGNALKDLKSLRCACLAHEMAISIDSASVTAWYNYGITLAAAAQYPQAIATFRQALSLPNGEGLNIEWELARCHLAMGNYDLGWPLFAARWKIKEHRHPYPHIPAWDGKALIQQRLLIWTEQGFGDTIQCLRFLPSVLERQSSGQVVVAIKQELLALAKSSYPEVQFELPQQVTDAFDVQASLLDLPGFFCNSADAIPQASGYLRPTQQVVQDISLRTRYPDKVLVGVVWTGSLTFAGNADRALPAAELLERLALPGVQLVSIQKGSATDESALFRRYQVLDVAPSLSNFNDTAQLIKQLDLVIMTDSSVAHLCGALGVPVWVLVPKPTHWLWMTDTTHSPWYDSMRLFRQSSIGYWNDPLDAVSAELHQLLNKHPGASVPTR